MTTVTTIKVSTQTRDRLKRQAQAAHLGLGEYLARLADDAERSARLTRLQAQIAATPEELLASWRDEVADWEHGELSDPEGR